MKLRFPSEQTILKLKISRENFTQFVAIQFRANEYVTSVWLTASSHSPIRNPHIWYECFECKRSAAKLIWTLFWCWSTCRKRMWRMLGEFCKGKRKEKIAIREFQSVVCIPRVNLLCKEQIVKQQRIWIVQSVHGRRARSAKSTRSILNHY